MIIALPLTAADEFSVHFGAAVKVGLFTVDAARRRIVRAVAVEPPARLPCSWADWLGAQGVKVILVGAISAGALQRMAAAGVKVVAGVRADAPILLAQAWLTGKLKPGTNACRAGTFAGAAPACPPAVRRAAATTVACCCLRGLARTRDARGELSPLKCGAAKHDSRG